MRAVRSRTPAGIKVNDVITAVDGTDVTRNDSFSEVSEMIRNKEDGTSVLTVYHQEADEPEEITVTISNVGLPTVSYWACCRTRSDIFALRSFPFW